MTVLGLPRTHVRPFSVQLFGHIQERENQNNRNIIPNNLILNWTLTKHIHDKNNKLLSYIYKFTSGRHFPPAMHLVAEKI